MSFLKVLISTTLIYFLSAFGGAHAEDCKEEMQAVIAAGERQARAALAQRAACGDLRLCKADCRRLQSGCKGNARVEKSVCIAECNQFSGSRKRQCKRDCRSGKRFAKASCRATKRNCKDACREQHKTPECVEARQETVAAAIAASLAGVNLYECRRKSGAEEAEEAEEARENQSSENKK